MTAPNLPNEAKNEARGSLGKKIHLDKTYSFASIKSGIVLIFRYPSMYTCGMENSRQCDGDCSFK